MKRNGKVQRGEVYFYNIPKTKGSVLFGWHPVVVIQCDEMNEASTTTVVAAVTSKLKHPNQQTHSPLVMDQLPLPSMVQSEQIFTVSQFELTQYVGMIGNRDTANIDESLRYELDLNE